MNIPCSTLACVISGFHTSLFGRAIVPACALLGSLAPTANAKAPDGTYAFTRGSGKVTLAGRTFPLSKKRLKEIASVKNGSVVIKNSKITLDRDAALNIINDAVKEMGFFDSIDDLNPTISLTGPSSLKFSKAGKSYVAATANPVEMKLSADVSGTELAGVVRSNFDAKVTGGKLVMHVKFGGKLGFVGSIDQQKIQGSADIVCTR